MNKQENTDKKLLNNNLLLELFTKTNKLEKDIDKVLNYLNR